jgi:hypothetical protein
MSPLPAMPIGAPVLGTVADPGGNAVATTGRDFLIPTAHPVAQVKVAVTAKAYVAFGHDANVPADPADWPDEPGTDGYAVQQIGEEVYTRAARRGQTLTHVWIAAVSGTTDVDVSYF